MAVIDILQHYDAKKKAAHAAKTVKHGVSAYWIIRYYVSSVHGRVGNIGNISSAWSQKRFWEHMNFGHVSAEGAEAEFNPHRVSRNM